MKHPLLAAAAFTAALAATLAAPRDAHAQVRATAHVGVEHLRADGAGDTLVQLRAEASYAPVSWFDLGLYMQRLEGLGQGARDGFGAGALAVMRPLPSASFGPLAYASLGYQRAPQGAVFHDGAFFELGGGFAWRPLPVLDLELRGGFVGLAGGERDLSGFTAGVAVSVHP